MPVRISALAEVTEKHIDELAEVLVDCVDGGASVSFMSPFSRDDARRFWAKVAADVANRVLDTVTGGIAEHLYEQLGWVRVGVVPDFALFPQGGYCATTFFYKSLVAR
ncbi:MAG TPA: hypothetical protein VMF89_05845 [Polyangiales bacterium]|nr:hypothetical protein [Polyangiales bacterium]